jgi:succinylglutamic semialdehyde dehydrogenase
MSSSDKALIGGQWTTGQGPELVSTSPVDESVVWSGNEASASQVSAAFQAARDAFGPWWDQPLENRIAICEKYAALVAERKDELAELIAKEIGKPLWESKTEAGAVSGKVAVSIDALKTRRGGDSFDMGAAKAVTRFKPHGVLAVLGPFNFPAHLPNGHIVPALLAGNTIVFKPSELAPAVGAWMAERWTEAGLPDGVLNLVQGSRETGIAISQQDQMDGLLFTGSSRAGKALTKTLAAHPQKILALEMGGNNPLVIHQADNLDAAAYLTIQSAYITAGQRCTCARRLILVEDENTSSYLDRLVEMISKVRFGFWNDEPEPFLGTVISADQGQRVIEAFLAAVDAGGESLVQANQHRGCDALVSPGLIDVTETSDRGDDEVFGPILNVIRVDSLDAAIEEANNTAYGLSAGLISSNPESYQQFIHQIRAGIVNWNRQTTGASGKLPFGGCGMSGNNRPAGYYAADYCSFPVASLESDTLEMPETTAIGIELDS